MSYSGSERRTSQRISARFIVSYRIVEDHDHLDVSQTKNLSLGGMLLTTNRVFDPGTHLALEIRLPFDPNPIMIIGQVVESKEIIRELIYDTRLQFLSIDENHRGIINKTVDYYGKKG